MKITNDVYNFVHSCLVDGGEEGHKMTVDEAEYTFAQWREEGNGDVLDEIEGLTPETFTSAWNEVLAESSKNEEAERREKMIAEHNEKLTRVTGIAMQLLKLARPNSFISVEYIDVNSNNITRFTDWQIRRNNIRKLEQYFLVWDERPDWDAPGGRDLLYAVNVSCDSILTAAYELVDLLARKF